MIDPLAPIGDGQTEVPDDVREHLLPTYISTLGELYEAEADNIARGTYGLGPSTDAVLDDLFLRRLHGLMFREVWRWAGHYRLHDVNIGGVDWQEVPARVRDLTHDTKTWMQTEVFPPDEIALRFHHRLVQIHPFVNGNGRHGRFAAEYLIGSLGRPRFGWGAGLGVTRDDLRTRYRQALQRMDGDRDDVADLLSFARS